MVDPATSSGNRVHRDGHDTVIVGASLAGCAAAIMLARAGARVALVDQRAEPGAFKRICSHYIQSSALATLERLGLLEPMTAAGAVRSRARLWTRWGWIEPPARSSVPSGINLRRELLDPLIRDAAANTPGVELMLGQTAQALIADGETVGVEVRERGGRRLRLDGKLLIGADGRDSRVAKLAGVRRRTFPHGRFAYGGYFEGPAPTRCRSSAASASGIAPSLPSSRVTSRGWAMSRACTGCAPA